MEIRDSGYCCCFYCNEGVNIKKSNSLIFITTLLCIECAMLMVFEHDIDIIFVCSQIEIFFFFDLNDDKGKEQQLDNNVEKLHSLSLHIISNQSDDHSVQVEEKQQQVETQLEETFLLVFGQSSKDLSSIQQVVFFVKFVDVESKQWQIEQKGKPVPIDQEQNGQKSMDGGFWNNVIVQFVAKFNWVDIITLQIRVHYSEENLQEQVDGIENNRKDKKPRFAIHGYWGL